MRIFITDTEEVLDESLEVVLQDLQSRFEDEDISFSEADIASGASVMAVLAEYKDTLYVGIPIALFFAGKKIEENLDAWGRILERCMKLFKRIKTATERTSVTVDNRTAAIIALDEVLRCAESSGYRLMNISGINGFHQEVVNCSDAPVNEREVSYFLYYMCIFEINDYRYYEVIVDSSGDIVRSDYIGN